MILLCFVITMLYAIFILSLILGFDNIPVFKNRKEHPQIGFSIVIPFRNEAENLSVLLNSLCLLDYPSSLFEILLVDDDSEDSSCQIIETFRKETPIKIILLKNERTTNSPKKDAITTAIKQAQHPWILTTDADCIVPKQWLKTFDGYIQEHLPQMVCGPINYLESRNFLQRFQQLELFSLIGATIGGFGMKKPFMCNGANLCYSKKLFQELGGFDGNSQIASGDDVFLLEKALKLQKDKVMFLKSKDAIVLTKSAPNLRTLIQQRVRWASKSSHYKNSFGKLAGLIILVMNTLVVCLIILSSFHLANSKFLLYCFVVKFYLDLWLIVKTSIFFDSYKPLISYIFSSFIYPILSVTIAVNSAFLSYEWKGRRFRR